MALLFDANEFCLPFTRGLAKAPPPPRYSKEFLVGVCHPVVQMITGRSKKMQNTCLHRQKLRHHYLDWNNKEKIS